MTAPAPCSMCVFTGLSPTPCLLKMSSKKTTSNSKPCHNLLTNKEKIKNKMRFVYSHSAFETEAKTIFKMERSLGRRKYQSLFGTSSLVTATLWNNLDSEGVFFTPPRSKKCHLLWSLYFLKAYPTEDQATVILGTTRDTFCRHVQKIVTALWLIFLLKR